VVALGGFAWTALWPALGAAGFAVPRGRSAFGHGVEVPLDNGVRMLGCYHPSQQNTFTGRVTACSTTCSAAPPPVADRQTAVPGARSETTTAFDRRRPAHDVARRAHCRSTSGRSTSGRSPRSTGAPEAPRYPRCHDVVST